MSDNVTLVATSGLMPLGMTVGNLILACCTLFAAAAALYIGLKAASQTKKLRQIEHTERLLDELRDWALRYLNALNPNPTTAAELVESAKLGATGSTAVSKANEIVKLMMPMLEGAYVREIADQKFKDQLGDVFESLDVAIVSDTFLSSVEAKAKYIVDPKYERVIDDLRLLLSSKEKTLPQLIEEHRRELRDQLGLLLSRIADIKVGLV